MNYLAHLLLSGPNDQIKVGNFIADGLKSKDKMGLPARVLKGVALHYKIDDFTDSHPVVDQSVARLFDKYGHYSRVIVDLFYDHFLGKNWSLFSDQSLQDFSNQSIEILKNHQEFLPARSLRFLNYIEKNNTLFEYSKIEGMELVLFHFSTRAKEGSRIEESISDLKSLYSEFNSDFLTFFPQLLSFVQRQEEYNSHFFE